MSPVAPITKMLQLKHGEEWGAPFYACDECLPQMKEQWAASGQRFRILGDSAEPCGNLHSIPAATADIEQQAAEARERKQREQRAGIQALGGQAFVGLEIEFKCKHAEIYGGSAADPGLELAKRAGLVKLLRASVDCSTCGPRVIDVIR